MAQVVMLTWRASERGMLLTQLSLLRLPQLLSSWRHAAIAAARSAHADTAASQRAQASLDIMAATGATGDDDVLVATDAAACLAALPLLMAHPVAVCMLNAVAAPRSGGAGAACGEEEDEAAMPREVTEALRDVAAAADAARARARLACVCRSARAHADGAWPKAARASDGARARACNTIASLLARSHLLFLATPALLRLCAAATPPGGMLSSFHSPAVAWALLARCCLAVERDTLDTVLCAALGIAPAGGVFDGFARELVAELEPETLRERLLPLIGATRAETGLSSDEDEDDEELA
jgi:hypothetical protein